MTRKAASIASGTASVLMGPPRRVSSLSGVRRVSDSSGGVVASGLSGGSASLLAAPDPSSFPKVLEML